MSSEVEAAQPQGEAVTAGATESKIEVLLKAVGDAPILKQKKWAVSGNRTLSYLNEMLRKMLKTEPSDALVSLSALRRMKLSCKWNKYFSFLVVSLRERVCSTAGYFTADTVRVLRLGRSASAALLQKRGVGLSDDHRIAEWRCQTEESEIEILFRARAAKTHQCEETEQVAMVPH